MEAVVEEIGGCCSTGAESKTRQLFSFERNSAIMLITIKNPGMFFCFDLLRYNLDIVTFVVRLLFNWN
uniref:Uncharacterized protein n=2 Tax=Strongyloides stercoralis TaxID=6248 RepID=A0A0K0DSI0_STRER